MKPMKYMLMAFAALLMTACDSEMDLKIIEGELPIKTSTLYMVGDATPNGWSIDSPTPLTPTADDALVFVWEGPLYKGEMKLCLTVGSWDAAFIRPEIHGTEINKTATVNQKFEMHAGDPDNKWRVTEAGEYRLTFDLRHWQMSTEWLGEIVVKKDPLESETLYMVGDATPNGWSMDNPTPLTRDASNKYLFTWEGNLNTGDMKACLEPDGTFSCPFLRPSSGDVEISSAGVSASDFVYTTNPDDKWHVTEAGSYSITFDLENYTIHVEKK